MTPDEITAHCNGKMLKSSLEIYVPLSDEAALENLAQSTNTVTVHEDVTGINDIQFSPVNSKRIYNISGQGFARLQRGVNIIGGKKVIKE